MDEALTTQLLLRSCDEAQRAAITSPAKPLLLVAGAGSGKTRVLTRRIAYQVVREEIAPEHVVALTFTRKAASELRSRLSSLGLSYSITAGTFHALALSQLRRLALDRGRGLPVVVDSKARLLGAVLNDRKASLRVGANPGERREAIAAIASEIEWSKARGVVPDAYPAAAARAKRTTTLDATTVAAAFEGYEREKGKRRILDFDDLLLEMTKTLREDPDFAASQRWRFRHFFLDELQDATPAQLNLLEAWLGGRPDLFAVGDHRQAIYGWNGADASAVEQFTARFSGATVLHLDANFRSTPQVVAVASAALDRSDRQPGQATRPDGRLPTVVAYEDDQVEARSVATAILRARAPGERWSSCAVLARTNAQLRLFERALAGAHVPTRVADPAAFFSSPAVAHALEQFHRCRDASSFSALLHDLEDERPHTLSEFDDAAQRDGADGSSSPQTGHEADRAQRELSTLLRLSHEYVELDPVPNGPGCITYLREALRRETSSAGGDAVDLVTFHRAKGLEWKRVWVTGLEEGFVPIAYARSKEALAEERRLLYVALSRAEDELHCSWARLRQFGARAIEREPSPWLVSIEAACQVLARQHRRNDDVAAKAIAESRAHLSRNRTG